MSQSPFLICYIYEKQIKKGVYIMRKMVRFMKKYKGILLIILSAVLILSCVSWIQGQPDSNLLYTQEYVAGTGNIKGDVDKEKWDALGEAFEIGANADGYAVFKNPRKAMKAICKDYKKGIKAMQKDGAPVPFRSNYSAYVDFGHTSSKDKETNNQASIVSSFVDIYENSFVSVDSE